MARYNSESGGLGESDYHALAQFRYQIRQFMRFSETAAREAGLETQQYQLMLAVKAEPEPPTMGRLADQMCIQHHSAVELVNRSEQNGLVRRVASESDRRKVMLELTPRGEKVLRQLARHHRAALSTMAPMLVQALNDLTGGAIKPRAKTRTRTRSTIATTTSG